MNDSATNLRIDSLQALLEQLNGGDAEAAEAAFIAYAPYLRKVVRRLLPAAMRPKFDSIDIVQSVYCDILSVFRAGDMHFSSVAQLSAFLTRATRNRFIDRVRTYRTAARLEQQIHGTEAILLPATMPRPSESAAAAELWERLLALCPPEHRFLLELRRHGASPSEIAAQLGLHHGSVSRVLRELAIRMACSVPSA